MASDCFNNLRISNLLPEQQEMIRSSFLHEECRNGFEWTSKFLSTFCPEPDSAPSSPVNPTDTDIDKNRRDWRISNWGTYLEPYCVSLCEDASRYKFDCCFYSVDNPPVIALHSVSKQFPNAVIVLSYEDPGMDFCGVTVLFNGNAYSFSTEVTTIKDLWLKKFDPDFYEELEDLDEDDLEDELTEYWSEHESDAIEWVIEPISKRLEELMGSPVQDKEAIDIEIDSVLFRIDTQNWHPCVPIPTTAAVAQAALI
jgi:hypothetical protein